MFDVFLDKINRDESFSWINDKACPGLIIVEHQEVQLFCSENKFKNKSCPTRCALSLFLNFFWKNNNNQFPNASSLICFNFFLLKKEQTLLIKRIPATSSNFTQNPPTQTSYNFAQNPSPNSHQKFFKQSWSTTFSSPICQAFQNLTRKTNKLNLVPRALLCKILHCTMVRDFLAAHSPPALVN